MAGAATLKARLFCEHAHEQNVLRILGVERQKVSFILQEDHRLLGDAGGLQMVRLFVKVAGAAVVHKLEHDS